MKLFLRWKFVQVILFFGILQCGLTALGVYFFDYFAGSATAGFARTGAVMGTGMFFVYMMGYLNSVVVTFPVFLTGRFGAAALTYIPYVLVGLPVEYYYEVHLNPVLKGLWAVVVWCLIGPLIGLAADLAWRYLPKSMASGLRAALTGAALGVAGFVLTLGGLATLYRLPLETGPGSFFGLAYFGAPWLIIHSALGGFTAAVLVRELRARPS